jgi:hypothetical protein
MPLTPPMLRGRLVTGLLTVAIVSSLSAEAPGGVIAQRTDKPARVDPWPCRVILASTTLRSVVEKGMERSETIRGQCEDLAVSKSVLVLEWGVFDSQSHARTEMGVRDGAVVATIKLPPLGDTIVLLAHELQHVVERTRGLDLPAEARRPGSGVWRAFGGYETQAAVDVSRQVARELRDYGRTRRK